MYVHFTEMEFFFFSVVAEVRMLACNVVEQWLAVVKAVAPQAHSGAIMHPDVIEVSSQEIMAVTSNKSHSSSTTSGVNKHLEQAPLDHNIPVYKITIRDGKKVLAEVISSDRNNVPQVDSVMETEEVEDEDEEEEEEEDEETIEVVPTSEPGTLTITTVSSGQSLLTAPAVTHPTEITSKESVPVVKEVEAVAPAKKTIRKTSRSSSEEIVSPKAEPAQRKTAELKKLPQKKRVEKRAASPDYEPKSKIAKDKKKGISPDKKPKLEMKFKERSSKEKLNKEHKQQEDKDRAVLSKLITPSLEGIGKIPKKSDKKKEDENNTAATALDKEKKKTTPVEPPKKLPPKDPKKYNISIETRKGGEERPKTVKTFNSKFRSTGLEEPPPPPRAIKKVNDKKEDDEKKSLKRTSPVKEIQVPEKKSKDKEDEKLDKIASSPAAKPKSKSNLFDFLYQIVPFIFYF